MFRLAQMVVHTSICYYVRLTLFRNCTDPETIMWTYVVLNSEQEKAHYKVMATERTQVKTNV